MSRLAVGSIVVFFLTFLGIFLGSSEVAGYAGSDILPTPQPQYNVDRPYVPHLQPPNANNELMVADVVPASAAIITNPVLDMKILVIRSNGTSDEGIYDTATIFLDILGVPYDTLETIASGDTLKESDLSDGVNHGRYYAVFITTSNVWYALSANDKTLLQTYERDYAVRQVTWYAYPSAGDYGLDFTRVVAANNETWCPGTPQGVPFNASLTTTGQSVFHYLHSNVLIPMDGGCLYGYMATPAAGADVTTIINNDSSGETFLAVFRPGDGREQMVMTVGSYYPSIPPGYIHARILPYGIINWATKGLFLGEHHAYFTPQPDDVFSWGDLWNVETHDYILDTGYRNEPSDLVNLVDWMTAFKTNVPNAARFRIEMPFNGDGTEQDRVNDTGPVIANTLTAKAVELEGSFTWLNHTYTHRDLNHVTENIVSDEIYKNTQLAAFLGLTDYAISTLLTGDYSGLNVGAVNPNVANAAYALGVRFMEANASVPEYNNPTPNTGIHHPNQPDILLLPRYANNVYYATTNPEEETDLYNMLYCPGYAANPNTTPLCFDYATIMDAITNQALGFLLDYSVNATMFHMNNFDEYSDGRTLMTDYIEELYGKYNAFYNNSSPILSLRTQEIGQVMLAREAYNASGVTGQLTCGNVITLTTTNAATIPVTGVNYGSNVETYANQPISYLAMSNADTLVIPGETPSIPAGITDLSITRSGGDVLLSWSPTSQDTDNNPLTALAYRVYARANDPYFTPTPDDLLSEVTSNSFTHVGGTGDVDNNYTYVITAIGDNCWKRESVISNRMGEFDYRLQGGTVSDSVLGSLAKAADLKDYISSNTNVAVTIKSLAKWNPVAKLYTYYSTLLIPNGVFSLRLGKTDQLSISATQVARR
ncbi:MAG TPA: hypothetical protein DEH25_06785 [Chloroflexi bacterium]|nr:hypothetical protein [Chloroflexota bacterium]HBY09394.1 hypothetical protein [Chloroflexota bacterium]